MHKLLFNTLFIFNTKIRVYKTLSDRWVVGVLGGGGLNLKLCEKHRERSPHVRQFI
jgi:hypothetical protein